MKAGEWMQGIPYEVAFWNNTYRWHSAFEGLMNWSHLGSVISLEGFDANGYLSTIPSPCVYDVGAGLSFAPGNFVEADGKRRPLDIHYVDPLASYFNRIARRHHRPVPSVEFGMMEHLSSCCPKDCADLVIIQNALDHAAQPLTGIYEALAVLRTGGILYLNHHPNEAEVEHYRGFHQWNIMEENGSLIIWNRQQRHNVSQLLESFAEVQTQRVAGHVIALVRKTADVPSALLSDKDSVPLLTSRLTGSDGKIRLSDGLRPVLSYWYWNAIQLVAQSFSLRHRMFLKRLLRR